MIQLHNPWGNETEWKGLWGDSSSEWTERRRRIIYDRMQQKGYQLYIAQLFLCRFFSDEYQEINYSSEWSKYHPQLKLQVTGNGPVDIFCFLQVEQPVGGSSDENLGIGF